MKTNVFELLFLGDFFSSPKRKSRRIPIALFAVLLLAACQPTPEADAVTNKAEGRLEQLIVAAPERVPVYTVRFRTFSTEEKEALTKKLLGDGPYFDGDRDRAIYANRDNMVRLYEAWLKALDEGCYGPGQQENYDF